MMGTKCLEMAAVPLAMWKTALHALLYLPVNVQSAEMETSVELKVAMTGTWKMEMAALPAVKWNQVSHARI